MELGRLVPASTMWLRTARFDLGLQVGALVGIAPALLVYAICDGAQAKALLPLGSLVAIPFLHVFASFLFAFSAERNRSASSPRRLAVQWGIWGILAVALQAITPRGLASFALVYGGWHILRQNFGFLRELAWRAGLGRDVWLRRFDLAACAAPALALWMLLAARGPWAFLGADIYHLPLPSGLLIAGFLAVPATWVLRERWLVGRTSSTPGLLLLFGNALSILGPALFLDDLLLIYTLSASYHGTQYLLYLADLEREARPSEDPNRALLPLASAILGGLGGWFAALLLVTVVLPPRSADQALILAWYAIVPFHYFVDGRIWRGRGARGSPS